MTARRTADAVFDAGSTPPTPPAREERAARRSSGRPAPDIVVTRSYEPDLARQVAALLALLDGSSSIGRAGGR
jgi:hypothetical protein